MARENLSWDYDRIMGAFDNLGHSVSASTILNVLQRHRVAPEPERSRRTTWITFLWAHWELLAATDFFTVEVWTARGLVTHYVLFSIYLATRKVTFVGITTRPNGAFMAQVARQLIDEFDGPLLGCRFLVVDRDTKFTNEFEAILKRRGVEPVLCPPRAPNCNAFAERSVRSAKEECFGRIVPIGSGSVRVAPSLGGNASAGC